MRDADQGDRDDDHTSSIARVNVAKDDILGWGWWCRRIEGQPLIRQGCVRRPDQTWIIVLQLAANAAITALEVAVVADLVVRLRAIAAVLFRAALVIVPGCTVT
jgi:hypothetical protein